MAIIIDGKEYSKEEAMELLSRNETVIKKLKVDIPRSEDDTYKAENTHEGFLIPKKLISQMSQAMETHEADKLMLSFKASHKIMGRNLYVIMVDPESSLNQLLEEKV